MKKFLCILAILVIVLPVLVSCGSNTTTTNVPSTTSSQSTTKPPTTTSVSTTGAPSTTSVQPTTNPGTTTSAAAPSAIKVAIGGDVSVVDPAGPVMSNPYVSGNIFELLFYFDKDKKLQTNWGAGESWTQSPDGKMLEVKLRKGVKFSNGDPLTATDVKFSLERAAANSPPIISQLRNFDKSVVVDDNTIDFYFKSPNVQFIYQTLGEWLYMIPKAYFDKVGEDKFVQAPIGSGPYKIVDWKANQYVNLEANEYYWGPKPAIQKASLIVATDPSTRVAMLQAGEVDLLAQTPWQQAAALDKAGFKSVKIPNTHVEVIQIQTKNPDTAWYKPEVRMAIDYAIDKDALINKLFGGIPIPVGSWLTPSEIGYDPTLKPAYPYDIKKARDLMVAAGYPNGFELPLAYVSSSVGAKDVLDYLSQSLLQLGITVKPTPYAPGPQMMDFIMKSSSDTTAKAVILNDIGMTQETEPTVVLQMFYDSRVPISWYGTPATDKLIDQATVTIDSTQRGDLIKQVFQQIDKDLPIIPIYRLVDVFSYKSNIVYTQTVGGMSGSPVHRLLDLSMK